jgi:hypothetical protein
MDSSTLGIVHGEHKLCNTDAMCWYADLRASSNLVLGSEHCLSQKLSWDESTGLGFAFIALVNSSSIVFAWKDNIYKSQVSHSNYWTSEG